VTTYGITLRRDPGEGVWLVHVTDDDRLHSYGRTVARAEAAIREVIALWHQNDEGDVELEIDRIDFGHPLGGKVAKAWHAAKIARSKSDEVQRWAAEATADAARQLVDAGVSLRDTAEILGVSFQRVHQLVGGKAGGRSTGWRESGKGRRVG
jgi:predicted RNase H-like HicB family nuclease